jgi:hypothetical protein
MCGFTMRRNTRSENYSPVAQLTGMTLPLENKKIQPKLDADRTSNLETELAYISKTQSDCKAEHPFKLHTCAALSHDAAPKYVSSCAAQNLTS